AAGLAHSSRRTGRMDGRPRRRGLHAAPHILGARRRPGETWRTPLTSRLHGRGRYRRRERLAAVDGRQGEPVRGSRGGRGWYGQRHMAIVSGCGGVAPRELAFLALSYATRRECFAGTRHSQVARRDDGQAQYDGEIPPDASLLGVFVATIYRILDEAAPQWSG